LACPNTSLSAARRTPSSLTSIIAMGRSSRTTRPDRGQIGRSNGREESSLPPRLSLVLELSEEELDALVEEATVDAYNDEEQLGGFAVMIEDNLEMPFETTVLGVMVTVNGVTQTEFGIVADRVRDEQHQAISVLDLPLPEPPPKGAEWIAAYRHWARFA
jgi:Calcium binding